MPKIPIKSTRTLVDTVIDKGKEFYDAAKPKIEKVVDDTKKAATKIKRKTKKKVNNAKSKLKEVHEQAKQKAEERASVVDVTDVMRKHDAKKRIKSRNRDIAVAGTAGAAAGLSLGSMKKEEYDELKVIRDKLANDKPLTRREKDILFALQLGD